MTETVDSKTWMAVMRIEALHFRDMVAPPQRISAEELISCVAVLLRQQEESILPGHTWLDDNPHALESVLRGLSQEAQIDRGSFAPYAE